MKRILLTCYNINPIVTNEEGAAWKMIEQIARHQEVALVTRECYRDMIERYWQKQDFKGKENMQVYYHGKSRATSSSSLTYYLWQWGLVDFIRKQDITFDIVQDINLSYSWVPTFLWQLEKPLVWGPIGHQPNYPGEYVKRSYGSWLYGKQRLGEMMRRFLWRNDPFLKQTKAKATRIITINDGIDKAMKLAKEKSSSMPVFGADLLRPVLFNHKELFEILCIGKFTSRNGFDLAIKSFARFYKALPMKQQRKTRLNLLGNGPQEMALRTLIAAKNLGPAVRIVHCTKPAQLDELYRNASMLLAPSHEGMGEGIPQALAYGLPVLCFENEGAGAYVDESCGRKVVYSQYEHTVDHLTTHLDQLFVDKSLLNELSAGAQQQFQQYFTWDRKGEILRRLYAEVLEEKAVTPTYTS